MQSFYTFIGIMLMYFSMPSYMWNFDGVACATAIEIGNLHFLFHGNHLLYGYAGLLWYKLISLLCVPRALAPLQALTSLLSAIGFVGVHRILINRLRVPPVQATLLTIAMAATPVVWTWSVEAQVYSLGFAALAWATFWLTSPEHPVKPWCLGIFHGLAILGHITHVLWFIPACYWLLRSSRETPVALRRTLFIYSAVTFSIVLIPYLVVMHWVIAPDGDTELIRVWLLGSSALTPDKSFAWHSGGLHGVFLWGITTLRFFLARLWPYGGFQPSSLDNALMLASGGLWFFLIGSGFRRWKEPWIKFAALWIGLYGLLYWSWEPATECYRLPEALPFLLIACLGLLSIPARWRPLLASLLLLVTFTQTLRSRIQPMNQPERNTLHQEILVLASTTSPQGMYFTSGDRPWIYLLYFTGRTAFNITKLSRNPEVLASGIKSHIRRGDVYIHESALTNPLLVVMLKRFHQRRLDKTPGWIELR